MAEFVVDCVTQKPGTFAYLKLVSESGDVVILDRRESDRRRIRQPATPERRDGDRRRRDVMSDLHKSGWALRYIGRHAWFGEPAYRLNRKHPARSIPSARSAYCLVRLIVIST